MKKFLALALILTLALSINIFADTKTVVGDERTGAGNFEEGWTAEKWDTEGDGQLDSVIAIKVTTGGVQSRYSVDITYDEMTFSITGSNLVWDVNSLEYVVDTTSEGDDLEDKVFKVTVTNYSDKPVYLTAAIDDKADGIGVDDLGDDTITVSTTTQDGTAAKNYNHFEIASAVGTDAGTEEKFGVKVHADDWTVAANKYAGILSTNGTQTIATCTLTIAKD